MADLCRAELVENLRHETGYLVRHGGVAPEVRPPELELVHTADVKKPETSSGF